MSTVILAEITNIRLFAPDTLDPDDEDAVIAWTRENLSRVREAATECDPRDVYVINAYAESDDAPEEESE